MAAPWSLKYRYTAISGLCCLDQGSSCLKWSFLCSSPDEVLLISQGQPKHNLPLEPSSVPPTGPGEPSLHSPKELVSSCIDCSKLGMGKHCVFSAEQRLSVSHQIRLPPQEWDPLLPHLRENSLRPFTEHLKHAVMSGTTATVGRTLIMHIIETSVFLSP